MKKFLLTAALILALATSLTAGTMAYYNQAPAAISNESLMTATTFRVDGYRGTKATDTFKQLDIYPGCNYTFQYTLENVGETYALVTTASTLTCKGTDGADMELPDGVTVTTTIAQPDGDQYSGFNSKKLNQTKYFTYTAEGGSATRTFSLGIKEYNNNKNNSAVRVNVNVSWPFESTTESADNAYAGSAFSLKFEYSAVQNDRTAVETRGNQASNDGNRSKQGVDKTVVEGSKADFGTQVSDDEVAGT